MYSIIHFTDTLCHRFLGKLKKMVKNKACVEGSLCEAYLYMETNHLCSYYFESHVSSMRTRSRRNEFEPYNESFQPTLSAFELQDRPVGKATKRYLSIKSIKPSICTFC